MSLADLQLGRLIRTVTQHALTNALATISTPANNQRVGIAFSLYQTTIPTATAVGIKMNGVKFVFVNDNAPFIKFDLVNDGDIPMQAFTYSLLSGGAELTVIEHFLPESSLSAGVQAFQGQYRY